MLCGDAGRKHHRMLVHVHDRRAHRGADTAHSDGRLPVERHAFRLGAFEPGQHRAAACSCRRRSRRSAHRRGRPRAQSARCRTAAGRRSACAAGRCGSKALISAPCAACASPCSSISAPFISSAIATSTMPSAIPCANSPLLVSSAMAVVMVRVSPAMFPPTISAQPTSEITRPKPLITAAMTPKRTSCSTVVITRQREAPCAIAVSAKRGSARLHRRQRKGDQHRHAR